MRTNYPWLDNLPPHWEKANLGHVATVETGSADVQDSTEGGEFPFFVRSDQILRHNTYTHDTEAVLTAGDGRVGEIFHHANGKFAVHQRVYVIQPGWLLAGRYLLYAMKAHFGPSLAGTTAKSTVESLRRPMLTSFQLALPPLDEQKLLADYLDREIAEIDDILVEHKLLRDLLFERRTEVITTATRSSNPELREAPLVRLRHVAGLNPSPRMNIASNSDQVFPLYNMDSISEFGSLRPPVLRPYSELANGYSYLEPTDVAYAKVTPCFENGKGLVGTELDGPSFATTELTVFRPSPELDQNYLALVLQSADFHAVGEASMTGAGGLKRVSETAARNYRFPLPDKKTQTRIVEKVRFEVDSTNALISDSSRLSDLLTERRAALISAAVTGQIDVSAHDESGPEQFRNDLEANV